MRVGSEGTSQSPGEEAALKDSGSSCQVSEREREREMKEPERKFCLARVVLTRRQCLRKAHLGPLTPCRNQSSAAVGFPPALSLERRLLQNS